MKKGLDLHWIKLIFWVLSVALGGMHAWAASISHSMNPDGISYLDMGEAYLRGDWSMAINGYWSPFYSWLLGLAIKILRPEMDKEFPVVHLVNFLIYLAALVCFEFLWNQLDRYRLNQKVIENSVILPAWAWWSLGYLLFIYASLNLVEIWSVTPDLCVMAFVFLASGWIVRIRNRVASWSTFALLGVTLGLGYLAKAPMFLLAFVFIATGLFLVKDMRQAVKAAVIVFAGFLLIGGPFIFTLSQFKGRFTFGDSGKLNYVRLVNGLPDTHWQGNTPGNGTPIHPTRKIFDSPPIYEFATPIQGTYPPWYDPSYWFEGVIPYFNWQQQLAVLMSNILFYFHLFFREQAGLIVGVSILYLVGKRRTQSWRERMQGWALLAPAMVAFAIYALVYVENRYLGPFIILLWADLFAGIHLPNSLLSKKLVTGTGVIMLVLLLANIGAYNLEGITNLSRNRTAVQSNFEPTRRPLWAGEVAEELHRLGVKPGDPVAIIGYGFDSFWARLAHVQITSEMLDWEADPFWLGDSSFKEKVMQAFKSTGAKAIVANNVPAYVPTTGWHQVGETSYYIYLFE